MRTLRPAPVCKYGSTPEQQAASREAIRQRGAQVGFEFRKEGRERIYNTFDAHRLLHWAGLEGAERQRWLKKALFAAYFTQERFYTERGIQAVPAVVINDRHLIQGGQPPEVFEQALRQLAAA